MRRWEVNHWTGTYVVDTDPGEVPSEAAREQTRRRLDGLLFDARHNDPEAVRAVHRLHRELSPWAESVDTSTSPRIESHQQIEEIGRELELAVRQGRLAMTLKGIRTVRQAAPVAGPLPAAAPPPGAPSPSPSPASTQPEPMHFEVLFTDEFGTAVSGDPFEVIFQYEGKTERVTSDGSGRAVLDTQGTSSVAWVQLADQAAEEALRSALKIVWDAAPRVQGREDEVLVEGDGIAVAFLKSSSRDQGELVKRQFRVVDGEPYTVSVQPYVRLAELVGLFFETNKCFLLPTAMASMQAVKRWYDTNPHSDLLVVGHTDTSGQDSYNEPLSLERAQSMAAFLQDKVDDWKAWYGSDKSWEKRWGRNEDGLMIGSLAARHGFEEGTNPTLAYQQWHNGLTGDAQANNWASLDENGAMNDATRTQLIGDYMNHDDTSLPADVTLTAHGCGEYFPLDRSGEELDENPADGAHDQTDRRVEMFFFDGETDILPTPPGDISSRGSPEYPEWRARAKEVRRFDARKVRAIIQVEIEHEFSYRLRAGGLVYQGDLDADERIQHDVPLGDGKGDLRVVDSETGGTYDWDVTLRALGEIDTLLGGQERLGNLGIYLGALNGTEDDETRAAVRDFQHEASLTPSGDYDSDTQQALTEAHDE